MAKARFSCVISQTIPAPDRVTRTVEAPDAPTCDNCGFRPTRAQNPRERLVANLVPAHADHAAGDHSHGPGHHGISALRDGVTLPFHVLGQYRLDAARIYHGREWHGLDAIDLILFLGAVALDRLSCAVCF